MKELTKITVSKLKQNFVQKHVIEENIWTLWAISDVGFKCAVNNG